MAFKVLQHVAILDGGEFTEVEHGDGAEYDVLRGGALLIRTGDYVQVVAARDWRYVVSDDAQFPLSYGE